MAKRTLTMSWKRILVPTDFSEASRAAFPYAIALAKKFGASLTLVHVVPSTTPADVTHLGVVLAEKRILKHSKRAIKDLCQAEIPRSVPSDTIVLNGAPAAEISALAKSFDLIVIATHGHTGLRHFFLGSNTEKVLRMALCPVLTVPQYLGWITLPDADHILGHRILVPTDFSVLSKGAVTRAARLAQRIGAKIDLLHVVEPPPYPEFGYAHIPMKEAGLREQAQIRFANLREEIPDLANLVNESIFRVGSVPQEILQTALLLNSDLIVMATHARKGLQHFALGSNAEKVLRHAHCPVLIFPPRK